ncbi:MAG: FAD-dependent oxidoreductase [Burkholderiales bacterium]
MKRVLLLGGGHSHLEVVRRFGMLPVLNTEITLVDAEPFSTYSGMLPGLIAGHYEFGDCHIDLARLAQRAGVRFINSRACGLDVTNRRLELNNGTRIDYDLLSINAGSTPSTAGITGADHALAVKPFQPFAHAWNNLIERARNGDLHSVVVIGGGAAGVEILLAMQFRLAQLAGTRRVDFALVTDAHCVLPGHNEGVRSAFERVLASRGITVILQARVEHVAAAAVILDGGRRITADAVVLATGAAAPAWFADTALKLDEHGFIAVDDRLRSESHATVFAAGDCASIKDRVYPKSGVYAVRQAPVLAENLRRTTTAQPLANYHPQRRALALISTGDKYAVASYGRMALAGVWAWRWKNYIDRKFVRRYNQYLR